LFLGDLREGVDDPCGPFEGDGLADAYIDECVAGDVVFVAEVVRFFRGGGKEAVRVDHVGHGDRHWLGFEASGPVAVSLEACDRELHVQIKEESVFGAVAAPEMAEFGGGYSVTEFVSDGFEKDAA